MAKQAADATEAPEKDGDTPDSPLLDLSDAAVRKMIKLAKKRGYVTYDELNEVLPSEQNTSDQIEDIYAMLNEMGINVVEAEEAEAEAEGEEQAEAADDEEESGGEVAESAPRAVIRSETKSEPGERTDDPVRMYLREMGSVELLSREGEIAIAKRIEAGREAMIAGLCESPLTFQAIIIWRDELVEGKVLLRDIIDLEATYAGPEAKNGPIVEGGSLAPEGEEEREPTLGETIASDDDDDMENSLSLAAMEAEIKPKVLETFDGIADNYKKLRRLQDQNVESKLKNESLSPSQDRKYKKLKDDLILDVKSLSLNQARIDNLVEQLYDINKRLVSLEGRLMRLAESFGVTREDFLKQYQGSELDPKWISRVKNLTSRGWKGLVGQELDGIRDLRSEIHALATETGLEIQEFRNIVQMV